MPNHRVEKVPGTYTSRPSRCEPDFGSSTLFFLGLLGRSALTTATFVAGGSSFSTYGIQYNEPVFLGGVGMDMAGATSPLAASLNYDLQAGNSNYNGIFSITISYKL